MSHLILIAILVLLSVLCIQDLKDRYVSVWIFPVLALLFITYSWSHLSLTEVTLNLLMIALVLLVLTLYLRMVKGTYQLTAFLGIGDILFWVCMAVLMSPVTYLLFFTGSLLGTIILILLYSLIRRKTSVTIPLAGIQAALLACCMLIALWFPEADIRQTWMITL